MTVVNVFDVVTVTVTTRCLLGQLVATGLVQLFADGLVAEKVPVSVAHWHSRLATAVMPVVFVAADAADCMPAVSTLVAEFVAPYCAPARAASVSAIAV